MMVTRRSPTERGIGWTEPVSARGVQVCRRCVYDNATPGITFDEKGICNFCALHDEMHQQYPTGREGDAALSRLASQIRATRRGRYDCVVGVSGGCDSSFLVH